MSRVIQSLKLSQNALLESPTGTGKTLCLLCSSLAWQNSSKPSPTKIEYNDGIANFTVEHVKTSLKSPPSVIVYASRTHSQLSQVITELWSTTYRPRMAVLGSREQLCVHEKVSALRGSALNHACNSMSAQRKCMYKNNLENFHGLGDGKTDQILDIEQLGNLGRREKICPYFYTRDSSVTADLILLPYNYLLETSIRATLKIEWKNSVIIFDEAHNIERVAADAASCTLTSTDIAQCISELQHVLRLLQSGLFEAAPSAATIVPAVSSGDVIKGDKPTIDCTARILKALFEAENRIDSVPLSSTGTYNNVLSRALPGSWMIEMMEASGFVASQVDCHDIHILCI